MAGAAVRESMTFVGRPDQVREARAFVGRLLGPSHPCRDVAVLLASEMVTNCVLHGGSSVPGEAVTVTVVAWAAGVRVEVTGRKPDAVPVLRRPDDEAEGNRGLTLVEELAVRWGYERGGGQATTWFELRGLLQPMQHSAVRPKEPPAGNPGGAPGTRHGRPRG